MRRKLVLLLVLLLSLLLITFIVSVIMEWKPTENSYDPDLFGVHESLAYRSLSPEYLNISRAFETMDSLGVRKIRMSFWRGRFMLNSTEIDPNVTDFIEQIIQKAHSLDMEIMCYAQDFPLWMRIVDGDSQTVPRRNMTEGSTYRMFLEAYEESWKTLARTFPNITMWEIGNEFNIDPFLHPLGFNETIPDSQRFSVQEKADITTDLLYYGSLGVHEGNPNAKTVLGGLAPHPCIAGIADFLDRIYKNIKSGRWPSTDPDDYFQIACWHPYLWDKEPTDSNWVTPNKAIHDVMKHYGDEDKRVVFSEFGYSDNLTSRENVSKYLLKAFQLARDNFPWLDTIYWFRLVEIPNPSKHNPQGFGIINLDWTWKPAAYAYQSLTQPEPTDLSSEWLTM